MKKYKYNYNTEEHIDNAINHLYEAINELDDNNEYQKREIEFLNSIINKLNEEYNLF